MTYPTTTYVGTTGQISLYYLISGRNELPRELALDYWTTPHANLVARTGGTHQYRTHMLDIERIGCWPQPENVQTRFPEGWRPDGIVEATFLDPSALAPTPVMDSVLKDEQNFLRRGLAYMTQPNGSLWHRDELPSATADLERPETRVIALLRRRDDVTPDDFAEFVEQDLVAAITGSDDIVEAKTAMFAPYDESVWPSVGVSHDHPAKQQYHGAVVLAGVNRIAVEQMFRSDAFRASLEGQGKMFECLHSIEVKNTVFMVEEGELQLPALRGFAIARILSRIGATSQAEEPVLSQVLTVPK